MAGNPLVSQGVLNRLRGSVTFVSLPSLNVTASFLGKAGISLSFDGPYTTAIDQMTGAVMSPEPYVPITVRIPLLKTQSLAAAFKLQAEQTTILGDCTVRPDSNVLPLYDLTNCSIHMVGELNFGGSTAEYGVQIGGYYNINEALWNT